MASTSAATSNQKDPRQLHDLISLISTSKPLASTATAPITIYPNDDSILSLLQARFRHDLPFTRLGARGLVVINPNKTLANENERSLHEYAERAWDVSGRWRDGKGREGLQAHAYEYATRVYLGMRRTDGPQAVIFRGITASGKSHTRSLITRQLLHLSSSTSFTHLSSSAANKSRKIVAQIEAFDTLLQSFGHSKTQSNPSASKYSSYTELHFTPSKNRGSKSGAFVGAKVLTWGLDKSRLGRLRHEERTFHIFYQLLSGASASTRDNLMLLDDASDYALLASSGCFRLPSGPLSDDAQSFEATCEALAKLGFKDRHVEGLWTLLSALLIVGNIEFEDSNAKKDVALGYMGGANGLGGNVVDGEEEVRIGTWGVLEKAARLLGVNTEELKSCLTTKTTYLRKEVVSRYLDVDGAKQQRDALIMGLYTLLFAYVVESANHKVGPPSPSKRNPSEAPTLPTLPSLSDPTADSKSSTTQIVLLDLPGFTTRTPYSGTLSGGHVSAPLLNTASGSNGFTEFCTNFQEEILQGWYVRHSFEEDVGHIKEVVADGVRLESMTILDNYQIVNLIRGGPVTGDEKSAMGRKVGGLLGIMSKAANSVRKGGEVGPEEMVSEFVNTYGGPNGGAGAGGAGTSAFIAPVADPFASTYSLPSPTAGANPFGSTQGGRRFTNFGINHYAGAVQYGVAGELGGAYWVERDADILDAGFVRALRGSSVGFIKRLVSGPGISAEGHAKDPSIVVRAQVSIRPIRTPTPFEPSAADQEEQDEEEKAYSLDPTKAYPATTQMNSVLSSLLSSLERFEVDLWSVHCVRPNDTGLSNSFDKKRVRGQIRYLGLVDLVGRKQHEWVCGYGFHEFLESVGMTGFAGGPEDGIRAFASGERWTEGRDYTIGKNKIWLSWDGWRDIDDRSRVAEEGMRAAARGLDVESRGHEPDEDDVSDAGGAPSDAHGWGGTAHSHRGSHHMRTATALTGVTGRRSIGSMAFGASQDDLLYAAGGLSSAPATGGGFLTDSPRLAAPGGDWNGSAEWDKGSNGGDGYTPPALNKDGAMELGAANSKNGYANLPGGDNNASTANFAPAEKGGKGAAKPVEVIPTTRTRRWWVRFVWMCTWWIPSFLLSTLGGMKRSDIRMAWREKVTICFLILGMCGTVIFYVIIFGKLLCPDFNKAWSPDDLLGHDQSNNFWVSIQGNVYDISNFWDHDHSVPSVPMTPDVVLPWAGTDMTVYFPPPLDLACAGLVTSDLLQMRYANATYTPNPTYAVHTSGRLQTLAGSDLTDRMWYVDKFIPTMKQFYKGPLVWSWKEIGNQVNSNGRIVAVYNKGIYDLSDYIQTLTDNNGGGGYDFLDNDLLSLFKQNTGGDITAAANQVFADMTDHNRTAHLACLKNQFYMGEFDFRTSARCTVQNIMLLVFSALIAATILVKFLAALQLTSKRTPELLDKFIICQVPCYTEGEESLRRTIDSLAALKYDDKRKLLFLICDGNIVGSGNDRPTPRIALDILGVDPSLDPEPLMFKSIGEGSKQLNYGKVYSGLYEFEGHVVPYMVIVKVGKPSERQRPGNRGKRDSQILLLHYLNRVHFDAPMSPLELEIYHQMRNIIGIDPAFYEYIFMVDADTTVTPDSLNRLVAVTSDDSRVIAVCGETKLENEEGSWWTMIQVYEYYISHHLAKAFESLFGSVTCLPGCFSMYRIRTADKGRPLIISNRIIDEYSECNVDTLHKKNLLSLGEDRYLTTIMMKHFPLFKMKFTPDAIAHTVAPDRWSVLLSQRRRWINSTIHNLCELIGLGELCGFCCFSMRFIVFVDLLGTIILPATAVYLVWLIVEVATSQAPIPYVSIGMIAAVYGLQMIIFLLKREFMLIGWMIIYILAYPVYSFFLPLYSFWSMDDFSWGNTRIVVGEGKDKTVVYQDDEVFDESIIPLKKFSDYEAEALEYPDRQTVSDHSRPGSRAQSMAPPAAPFAQSQSHSRRGSAAGSQSGSQAGADYWQNTNLTHNNSSNPNLRLPSTNPMAQLQAQRTGSTGIPHLPSMPFGTGPGSDYGHGHATMGSMSGMGMMPMMAPSEFGTMPHFGYAGSAYGGSAYGAAAPAAPRNSVMTNLNMFGGGAPSMTGMAGMGSMGSANDRGGAPPSAFAGAFGSGQRPMSTFSQATSVNPFMSAPSQNANPTDEELLNVLRMYLSTQDLMTVTKKTAREAVTARFPKADLSSKKDFLNQSIERILSET